MTVPSTDSQKLYDGDGIVSVFPIPFVFSDNTHVQVTLIEESDDSFAAQAVTTHYTITGAGTNPATGNITMIVKPTSAQKLDVRRWVPLLQPTDFVTNGPFPLQTQENSLDDLTFMIQQLSEILGAADFDFTKTNVIALLTNNIGNWDAQTKQISAVLDPTLDTDVATKGYVDVVVTGTGQTPTSSAADDILVGNGTAYVTKTAEQFVALYAGGGLEADGSGNFQLDLQASGGLELNSNEVRCVELLRDIAGLTVARGDMLTVNSSGDIIKLAKGAANTVLGSDGTDLSYVNGTKGNRVQIQTQTASGSASIDFTSGINSTYDVYEVEVHGIRPATDGVSLRAKVSTNLGSSFLGGTDYNFNLHGGTAGSTTTVIASDSTGAAHFDLNPSNYGNDASCSGYLLFRFWRPTSTSTHFSCQIFHMYPNGSENTCHAFGSGVYEVEATDIDAIQFLFSSGNIAAGIFTLFGIKK